jgi:putative transcriptional regulator
VNATLRGQFLLASSSLEDENFARAVVLMIRHDDDGALGVIVNRPLAVTVADALGDNVPAAAQVEQPLHQGGPCAGPMLVLHTDAEVDGETVLPGLRFTAARADIEQIMTASDPASSRYIIGYAGWGSEQLEREFAEGSWLVTPATVDETFGESEGLWQKLAGRATLAKFIRPSDVPSDPNLN